MNLPQPPKSQRVHKPKRADKASIDLTNPARHCPRSGCGHITKTHEDHIKQVMEKHEAEHVRKELNLSKPQIPCQSCDLMVDYDRRSAHTKSRHTHPSSRKPSKSSRPSKFTRRSKQSKPTRFAIEDVMCNQCEQAWWVRGQILVKPDKAEPDIEELESGQGNKSVDYFDYFAEHQMHYCPNRPGCSDWMQLENGSWVRKVPIDGPGKAHGRAQATKEARKAAARLAALEYSPNSAFLAIPRDSQQSTWSYDSVTSAPPNQDTLSSNHPCLRSPYESPRHHNFDNFNDSSSSGLQIRPLEPPPWQLAPHAHIPHTSNPDTLSPHHRNVSLDPLLSQPLQYPLPVFPPQVPRGESSASQDDYYNGIPGQFDLPSGSQPYHRDSHKESLFVNPADLVLQPESDRQHYNDTSSMSRYEQHPPSYHSQSLGRRKNRIPRLTHRQALRYGDIFD